MFTVEVLGSKGEKGSFVCKSDSCTIGRSGKNLISIQGWRIDITHAELIRTEEGIFIHDRSSGNGLNVNGDKIKQYGPLGPADVITIGSYQLKVLDPQQVAEKEHVMQPVEPLLEKQQAVTPLPAAEELPKENHVLPVPEDHISQWRKRVQEKLMEAMDLRRLSVETMAEEELSSTISGLIAGIISDMSEIPADIDRDRLARDVLNEAVGLGPLEEFLADDSITEIMVNNYNSIFVERHGRLEKTRVSFSDNDAVRSVIERIVSPLGRRIDESSPMVDARLEDGSRVNAIIPPLAVHGPCLTIRKFSRKKITGKDLVAFGSISEEMIDFLQTAVSNRKNIIVSGGTGSGKTTFLNVVSGFIPHTERIVTVEDSAELQLEQPHVVTLEARPANVEGKGAVSIRDLVRNCLRMRPDRIVVGECRGGEALDMLQAMNTGHDGSLTTVHANSPRDLISRLEVMVMMSGMDLPQQAILEQITSAVDIIVQQARFVDGSRRITHITEITGQESGRVQMQNIFVFKQHGFDEQGGIIGEFTATGRIPEFYETLRSRGIQVNMTIFNGAE
jgi:pilus assembly protein CpaF